MNSTHIQILSLPLISFQGHLIEKYDFPGGTTAIFFGNFDSFLTVMVLLTITPIIQLSISIFSGSIVTKGLLGSQLAVREGLMVLIQKELWVDVPCIFYRFKYLYNIVQKLQVSIMKGKSRQRALYLQIRKNMSGSKPKEKRQPLSCLPITSDNCQGSTPLDMHQNKLKTNQNATSIHQSNQKSTSLVSGMDSKLLYMRKENHLNSCYNFRKNRLKQISKENKQIYKRINSQKSMYASADLNRSFESNKQIAKRLSQSKLSQRLKSSRSSDRSSVNTSQYKRDQGKKKGQIKMKTANINSAQSADLKCFQSLFSSKIKTKKQKQGNYPPNSTFTTINQKENSLKASSKHNYRKTLPIIKRQENKVYSNQTNESRGILHRVAEVMFTVQEQTSPNKLNGNFNSKKVGLL